MAVTRYDAKDTVVTVDDVFITNLGEDMVTGEKDEDFIETKVGAQGDVVINEKNDPLGTVTITVQPTSPQRAFLNSLAKRKDPFPIWCSNKVLGERFGGTMARLIKYPSAERSAEANDMEYEFKVMDYVLE